MGSGLEQGTHPGTARALVLLMMVLIIAGAVLPQPPEDFQPAFAQAAQGAGVALALLAFARVASLRPRAFFAAAIRPQMDGVT